MKKTILSIGFIISIAAQLSTQALANSPDLERAIAGQHRTEAWTQRDQYRHPLQTLKLFDVQVDHTVVEIWPGGGWYTEILAPYLREKGQLIAAHYDTSDTQAEYRPRSRANFETKMSAEQKVYSKVKVSSLMVNEKDHSITMAAAEPASVDRVVTFRNAHGWHARGTTDVILEHFFEILKAGGKLGIVQHMADPDQDWMSSNIGYVGREYIINHAIKAGFQLESEGFFNRNPLDSKRYVQGVWQLPPSLTDSNNDSEKAPYLTIGESNRMTLVFVKP
ncbi:MAG: putative methyltransferase [Porticoccaceae bacterium]|jgi:predicted methyltransferase